MSELVEQVRRLKWSYARGIEPHRQALYRYCKRLTGGDPFEAEDLHQETVVRAFGKLAERFEPVSDPKAYLFRMATNLWIDWQRRAARRAAEPPEDVPAAAPPPTKREVMDGAWTLLHRLPPREASALLLRDVFELSVKDAASVINCTEAAVKMAASRARSRLAALDTDSDATSGDTGRPPREIVERFAASFERRDIAALLSLIDEHARARVVGCAEEHGRDEIRRGSLRYGLEKSAFTRVSVESWRGWPLLAIWYDDRVGDLARVEAPDGAITRLDFYYFSPEVLRDVCGALGLPHRDNGYAVFERGWWNTEP